MRGPMPLPLLLALLSAAAAAVELVSRPAEAVLAPADSGHAAADQTDDSQSSDNDAGASDLLPAAAVDVAWRFGRATFYGDAPGDDLAAGACGFGTLGPHASPYGVDGVAAVADASPELNGGQSPCGRCFELRCVPALVPADGAALPRCGACRRNAPPLRVRVTDTCPCAYAPNAASNKRWCCGDAPHFDLAAAAFDRIAASRLPGVLGVAFRRVPCAPAGNVSLRVASAFAGDKAELVVLDAAGSGGVTLLESRSGGNGDDSAAWVPLRRGWGATWQMAWPGASGGAISVRVTAEDGAQLTLRDVIAGPEALRPGAELRTAAQFGALPQPPPPPLRGWPRDDGMAPLLPCPPAAGALAAAAQAAHALLDAAAGEAPCPPAEEDQAGAAAAAPQLPAWCRLLPAAMPQQLRPAGCVPAAAAALAAQSCGDH